MNLEEFMVYHLNLQDLLQDIDLIIPVPLHPSKKRIRGFNQSELISEGIAEVTGLPVDTYSLARITVSATQTKRSRYEQMDKC